MFAENILDILPDDNGFLRPLGFIYLLSVMDVFFLASEQQNILFLPFDYDTVALVFICHLTLKVFSNLGLPVCVFFFTSLKFIPSIFNF